MPSRVVTLERACERSCGNTAELRTKTTIVSLMSIEDLVKIEVRARIRGCLNQVQLSSANRASFNRDAGVAPASRRLARRATLSPKRQMPQDAGATRKLLDFKMMHAGVL